MAGNHLKGLRGRIILLGVILALFTGCGPAAAEPSDAAQTETKGGGSGYITAAQAKEAAFENAGISEETAKAVQVHLNTKDDVSTYEIAFASGSEEYNYVVDAVTGKIISMDCKSGVPDMTSASNMTSAPTEEPQTIDVREAAAQSDSAPETAAQGARGQETPGQSGSAPAREGSGSKAEAQSGTDGQYIGTEAAKQAALAHVGLKEEEVGFVHVQLEFDDGRWQYDVEFFKDNTEYDYSIDALTGEILKYDHDTEHFQHGDDKNHQGYVSGEMISPETAEQIALEYAGVAPADAQYLKAELDYDDGGAEYEIEWNVGTTEYSCDVDAYTGQVLAFEKDFD